MAWELKEYLAAAKDNPWIQDFAEKWIRNADLEGRDESLASSVMDVEINLQRAEPDAKLGVIVSIMQLAEDRRHDWLLGPGMLEDFLDQHGDSHISVIEDLARQDDHFRHLLGAVWKRTMSDELWRRVEAARGPRW